MKTNRFSLPLGFGLGVLAFLLTAQSRPPVEPVLRFQLVSTPSGMCVIDTATGRVKHLVGDPRTLPIANLDYAAPFYP